MFKKILLSLLAFLVLFSGSLFPSLVSYSHAQDTSWYNQTYEEWLEKVADDNNPDEIFGERYTAAQVRWILYSLVWILMGGDESVTTCVTQNNGDLTECISVIGSAVGPLNTVDSDIDGRSKNIFLAVFKPRPISTVTYFKDVASRFKLVPEAKAQGFGFGAASPVLGLWRMVRNVTYFLLIIAVIALSFMIMFRIRLTPQTIITVQSALPKLIIALILITFSYAIVGFLIDLMYVVIGLIAGIITTSGIVGIPYANNWSNMFEALTERSLFTVMGLFHFWFMLAMFASMSWGGWFATLVTVAITLSFFWVILLAIVGIILLFALVKILWTLIKAYVNVLLLTIMGPIYILLGSFSSGGFGSWIKSILANLAVFPAVGFMFIIAFVFLRGAFWQWESIPVAGPVFTLFLDGVPALGLGGLFPFAVTQQLGSGATWNPPFSISATQVELIWLAASLVIVLMIPKIADIIKSMIEGRPFGYGSAIGEAFTPVRAPLRGGFLYGAGTTAQYLERTAPLRGGKPTGWRATSAQVIRKTTGVR